MGRDAQWRQGRTARVCVDNRVIAKMGGTVSGSLWGLVLGGVGLGVVSLVNEQPGAGVPQVSASDVAEVLDDETGSVAEPDSDVTDVTSEVATSADDAIAPQIDSASISAPQMPDLNALSTLPDVLPALDAPAVAQDPALQPRFAGASSAPAPDAEVVITTQPAPPPAQVSVPDEVIAEAETPQTAVVPEVAEPDVAPELTEPAALPDVQAEAPVTETTPVETDAAAAEGGQSSLDEVPVADGAPVVPDEAPDLPETQPSEDQTPLIVVDPDAAPAGPLIVSVPEAETQGETETAQLPQAGPAVRVNRPGATPAETAGQEAEVIEAEPLPDDAPALERFATPFEGNADLPLISIVMLDAADLTTAPTDIAALAVPVTVVIDALRQDAAARMSAYRDAGVEVMLQTSLPPGAVPTDVEVAFEAAFAILPETVALFSDASGLVQENRSVAAQVVDILGAEGRGLVVVERGLSSSLRIAEQAGLPAVAVLRDLNGNGEDGPAVARALDQAAFRARQSGNAVLLARVSPETLDALRGWGADNNGDQIALAPVSAILRAADGTE